MVIGRLCHASLLLISAPMVSGSTLGLIGIRSLTDGSQNAVWRLPLEDEIPQNYKNRIKLLMINHQFESFHLIFELLHLSFAFVAK